MHIPKTFDEARIYQNELLGRLNEQSYVDLRGVHTIAGIDASYVNNQTEIIVGLIRFSYPELRVLDVCNHSYPVEFPYVPGYLAFREGIPVVHLIEENHIRADLLILDGHGIAHPRKLGIATFVGIMTQMPSIGIAKKKLIGAFNDLSQSKHAYVPLRINNDICGYVYRTRANVKPVFISPGYRTTLSTCLDIMKIIVGKVRIPIPTWEAHKFVTKLKQKNDRNHHA